MGNLGASFTGTIAEAASCGGCLGDVAASTRGIVVSGNLGARVPALLALADFGSFSEVFDGNVLAAVVGSRSLGGVISELAGGGKSVALGPALTRAISVDISVGCAEALGAN